MKHWDWLNPPHWVGLPHHYSLSFFCSWEDWSGRVKGGTDSETNWVRPLGNILLNSWYNKWIETLLPELQQQSALGLIENKFLAGLPTDFLVISIDCWGTYISLSPLGNFTVQKSYGTSSSTKQRMAKLTWYAPKKLVIAWLNESSEVSAPQLYCLSPSTLLQP